MTFAAQHPGKCSACGDLFPEGTHIRRDETRGYRHADCDGLLILCGLALVWLLRTYLKEDR